MTVISASRKGLFWVERDDGVGCSRCYRTDLEAVRCAGGRLSRLVREGVVPRLEVGQRVICPGPQSSEGFRIAA